MTTLEDVFRKANRAGEAAFLVFITAGDPSPQATMELAQVIVENGADILELGIPFSDPIADGPTIQASYDRALKTGLRVDSALEIAAKVKAETQVPLVILTYYNIILQRGLEAFFSQASRAGVNGLIIPDLPIEEANEALDYSRKHNVDLIFLVAPTTTEERLKRILTSARGFLYLVSLLGVTGARESLSSMTKETINRITRMSRGRIPVAVGFGISKPEHVHGVLEQGANGVIVGSAIIDLISKNLNNWSKACETVASYIRTMKAATKLSHKSAG